MAEEHIVKGLEGMKLGLTKEEALPEGLKAELMPKHVALVMDGNRRWAKENGLEDERLGFEAGRRVLLNLITLSAKWGIKVLSIFMFSTENWKRSQDEVDYLINMCQEALETYEDDFVRYNYRVSMVGDKSKLTDQLVASIQSMEERTKANKGMHAILAISYSGRGDIMQAAKTLAAKVQDGTLQVDDIDESLFDSKLQTSCAEFPSPDLLIRTGGEQRVTDFMIWQLAYTELYSCEKKFPEFEEQDYVDALVSFQKRDRRYGGKKYTISR